MKSQNKRLVKTSGHVSIIMGNSERTSSLLLLALTCQLMTLEQRDDKCPDNEQHAGAGRNSCYCVYIRLERA